jgi:Spherulation-specific family 4
MFAARSTAALLLAIALALCAASTAGAAWSTNNQHQLVPAYMYPDWWNTPNNWFRMCDAMNVSGGPSTAVMNPASGPGTAASPDYQRVIDYCHARGQHVIAYVHTSYGSRDAAAVRGEIDAYYRMYPAIDGIFFDEMSNASSTAAYYSGLYAYTKTKPGAHEVVGNPGAAAATAWQLTTPVADAVVIFEGSSSTYQRWSPPAWSRGRVASQISHLVYAASQPAMSQVCSLSKGRNAGYMYVTGDALPNPWDTLPAAAYWSAEIAAC